MKNIIITIKMLVIVLLLASCERDYLDVNTDPNNPTTVTPDLILPVAQNYSAIIQEGGGAQNLLGNLFMYNWSQSDGFSWYPDEFKYDVDNTFYDALFDYQYENAMKQYQALYDLEGPEYGYYHAISTIMKSYHFQILVDIYGDVPYSEALLRGENPTPVYDDAETIYNDLITQLTNAIAMIDATEANTAVTPVAPGVDDTMFNGDMEVWKAFANTVKLRILVRQSSMSSKQDYIKTEFAAIESEGSGFMMEDVEVQLGYLNEDNKMNPKWTTFGTDPLGNNTLDNDATCATDYVLAYLQATFDPRLDYIFEKPATGHLGVPQGLLDYDIPIVDQFLPEFVSNIGPGVNKSSTQAAVLYSLSECYLNQAEAAFKGLMTGDAKTLYESGIAASFNYLGTPDAADYYGRTSNLVGWDGSPDKMEAIMTQKWIASNGIDAIQSWFDYSRTGYPSNLPISMQATTPDRPVRLFYPSSEITSNGSNLPAQPDAFNSKIFWAN